MVKYYSRICCNGKNRIIGKIVIAITSQESKSMMAGEILESLVLATLKFMRRVAVVALKTLVA